MDQALGSISSASAHNALRSMSSNAQDKPLGSMQTPPVPSLINTSNSSQKLSNGALLHQLSTSNMPPLRPKLPPGNRSSHEIITIGDSPITKNSPPLLPTPSTGLTDLQSHVSHPHSHCHGFHPGPSYVYHLQSSSLMQASVTMETVENLKCCRISYETPLWKRYFIRKKDSLITLFVVTLDLPSLVSRSFQSFLVCVEKYGWGYEANICQP